MMCSGAKVGGVFEGSPDIRFEPGSLVGGEFRFEIGAALAATLVLQTVLAPLATAGGPSRVEVIGGTHVPRSPSFHYMARHWGVVMERMGLLVDLSLVRAGFYPAGGGEVRAQVSPWRRGAGLDLLERGPLRLVKGISGSGKLKDDVARRQKEAAQERLWEARRIESSWEVVELPAASPGSFVRVEAVFEKTRAAFGFLGSRGVKAELVGERSARRLLKFLDAEGAVDSHLADQMAVPLALGGGGRVSTDEVSRHLQSAASILGHFGIPARTWGRLGGPGGLEVNRC